MIKLKFSLLCLFLLLFFLNCKYYLIRDTTPYELNKEQMNFLKSKKFALVGFYPFDFTRDGRHAGRIYESDDPKIPCSYFESSDEKKRNLAVYNCITKFINEDTKKPDLDLDKKINLKTFISRGAQEYIIPAFIDYDSSTAKYFTPGKSTNQLQENEKQSNISKENLRNFLITFLSTVRHSGLREAESFLKLEYASYNKNCDCLNNEIFFQRVTRIQLKNFDVDYWVIAQHRQLQPYSLDAIEGNSFSSWKQLSIIPAYFTFSTFPMIGDNPFESKFYIYDRHLNLIKTFVFQNRVNFMQGWWTGFLNEYSKHKNIISPASVFEPDIKKLAKEIYTMIKEN